MKFSLPFFISVLFSICCLANQELIINSTINEVVVHPNNASIKRVASFTVENGYNTVVINNISNKLDINSLQILTSTGKVITEKRVDNMEQIAKSSLKNNDIVSESEQLRIDKLYAQLNELEAKLGIVKKKKQYLANTLLGNQNTPEEETITKLDERLVFYEDKFVALAKRERNLANEIAELKQANEEQLSKKEVDVRKPKSGANKRIVFTIFSEKLSEAKVKINYTITGVGWTPHYEIYCDNIESNKLKLRYNATFTQGSGEDWNNVSLSFSSNHPNSLHKIPKLTPVYVRYSKKISYRDVAIPGEYSKSASNTATSRREKIVETFKKPELQEFELSTNYRLDKKQTIPSMVNKKRHIFLADKELEVVFKRKTFPQIDKSVYLTAEIENWQTLNILPGMAYIYLQEQPVATTNLSNTINENNLSIPFGIDTKILVERTQIASSGKTKFLEKNKQEEKNFLTTISNNRNNDVEIELVERIPLSKDGEIMVQLNNTDYSDYYENLGYVTWLFNIKSKKSERTQLSYTLSYDKNNEVFISNK